MRTIRIELLIATLALLASAAASIATVVQTHVVGNQLSASVWPYLSVAARLSSDRMSISVDNDGLGPALVRSAELTVDGKPQRTWRAAIRTFVDDTPHAKINHAKASLDFTNIGAGSVIRPGESLQIFDARSPLASKAQDAKGDLRFKVTVCYCSILDQCWRVVEDSPDQPDRVPDCGSQRSGIAY